LPCRTFQHAHDTVTAGGEIDVLDPAGYGAVTITKAISIQGHGFAGVSGTGTLITIFAGAADTVHLNGLLVQGPADSGIIFLSGKGLVVENCAISNASEFGLGFGATTSQTLSVVNSFFADNHIGIQVVTGSAGSGTATITGTALYRNTFGIEVMGDTGTGPLKVAVSDSIVADGANGAGVSVSSDVGQSATIVMLTRVTSSGHATGIMASGTNATVRLARSSVTGNETGFFIDSGAAILSYGDNVIADNGSSTGTLGSATRR
jgi:hypothetical protein